MKDSVKKEVFVIVNLTLLIVSILFCCFFFLAHTTKNTLFLAVILSVTFLLLADFLVLILTFVKRQKWQKRYYIITGIVLLILCLTPFIHNPLDLRSSIAFVLSVFLNSDPYDILVPDLPFALIYALLKLVMGLLLKYKTEESVIPD